MRENPLHSPQISQIVDRQLGHVTRAQLLAAGLTAAFIERRIAAGELIPVHAGVYAVGHVPRHVHARACAAILACDPDAALSHAAAAALWDAGEWPLSLEVTAPRERRRPGIVTHRSGTLTPYDLRTHQGLRVISPLRTVLDLQSRLDDVRLARLVDDLRASGRLGPSAFAELCERSARVRDLLGDVDGFSRSQLEDRFRAFLRRFGLPFPEFNARLPGSGREVDALYREARLIIELDSWSHHRSRRAFEHDRDVDARATDEGYETIRITHRRLSRRATVTAARIERILARRSSD